uniref:Uncharacterized protein n=1 Tax=Setaria viridis TaxID=4556 RepID=A0A4U6SY92_SETVI|nr:hypothetical protein SEVIR_9G202600v2 [Setaria viridis]
MHVGYIITLGQLQRYKTAGSCKPEGKRDDQAQQTASSFVVREKSIGSCTRLSLRAALASQFCYCLANRILFLLAFVFQPAYKLKRTGPLETALVLCKLSTF